MRGSAAQRGYDAYWHNVFRPAYIGMLVLADIAPVCGAKLQDGPRVSHSQCQAAGLLTFASADGSGLQLNHEPRLLPYERHVRAAVCNPQRIELLCAECHSAATATG